VVQDIQLETEQAVQVPPINPYPDSQVIAVDKSAVQVSIPVAVAVHSAQVVPPTTGPYPLSQRVQAVEEQV
jgi:hypothetical protein